MDCRPRRALDPDLATATDADGRSAFTIACLAGSARTATALRATGMELDIVEAVLARDWPRFEQVVKAQPALCNTLHPIGGTPLHAAAMTGCVSMWRLRSAGCDPDAAPPGGNGFTPPRAALESRTISGARIAVTDLLANGSDPAATQVGGSSILHAAVERRSELLVRLAVRKLVPIEARDASGRTPLDLALAAGWDAGAAILQRHAELPRDHRASRFDRDANDDPIVRPDLSDVPQNQQGEVTGNSHGRLERVRQLVTGDPRLVFSISTDDELAIEASAHTGNRPLIRFHLDYGAPLSLPTAVALGDLAAIERMLRRDPLLIHERGAHDFPVMFYAVFGGDIEIAARVRELGVEVDQESQGATALHWAVQRNEIEFARWLIEQGAALEPIALKWHHDGQTPLQLAGERGRDAVAKLLRESGAKR